MAKVELTHELVADIKQKAESALNSNWISKRSLGWIQDEYDLASFRDCFPDEFENDDQGKAYSDAICVLEFIAAADPATVLAMVEEIEQLTKTSQELFDKTKALEQEIEQIKRQAENNVKHVPYYTGKGPLEQAIEILGTRELNKVIQSRKAKRGRAVSTYYYLCCEKCKKLVQFYAVRFPARVAFMKHYDDIPAFVERHIGCGTPKVISEHDNEFRYDEEFKHDYDPNIESEATQ